MNLKSQQIKVCIVNVVHFHTKLPCVATATKHYQRESVETTSLNTMYFTLSQCRLGNVLRMG